MFRDFFEDGLFKKTTKEEKKNVVKNTGDWFPEQQDNRIKGMDKVVDKIVENAVEKQKDIVNCRPGYTIKHCKICGKKFESYRGRQIYCSEKCKKEGADESRARYVAKKSGFVYIPKNVQKQEDKPKAEKCKTNKKFITEELFNKAKELRSTGMTIAQVAMEMGYSMVYMQKVLSKDTYEDLELQRKIDYQNRKHNKRKSKEAPDDKPITHVETVEEINTEPEPKPELEPQKEPEQQPEQHLQHEEDPDMKYIALMQKALNIVSIVKSTSDVKECINKVFDELNNN